MTAWDWQAHAACRGLDPELFFPAGEQEPHQRAREACAACLVRQDCLSTALYWRLEGYWGGTTEHERAAQRRRESRARQAGQGREMVA